MIITISVLLFSVFAFLSGIHFYWGFGGRWGSEAVFPTIEDSVKPQMPGALPTLIVAFGLLAMGVYVLTKAEVFNVSIPIWLSNYGLWILGGIFILRAVGDFKFVGFFKKVKLTKFGENDTKYYSPLCLLVGVLTLILELIN